MSNHCKLPNRNSRPMRVTPLLVLAAVALVVTPAPAAAYIDPASGSLLLQIVSAAVLAGAVTIGRARTWLFSLFRRVGTGRRPGVE